MANKFQILDRRLQELEKQSHGKKQITQEAYVQENLQMKNTIKELEEKINKKLPIKEEMNNLREFNHEHN